MEEKLTAITQCLHLTNLCKSHAISKQRTYSRVTWHDYRQSFGNNLGKTQYVT